MRPRRPGAVGVWSLFALAVGLLAAVLTVTTGRVATTRVELQTAADAAALAAAAELALGVAEPGERYATANPVDGRPPRVEFEIGPAAVRAVATGPGGGRAAATAVVETSVVGLRPGDGCPAPLAPFALPSDPTGRRPDSWEAQAEGDHPGEVRVSLARLTALRLGRPLAELSAAGLTDGRLDLPAAVPVWRNPPAAEVRRAVEWLRQAGVPRAWRLAADEANGRVTVRRLVAARVAAVGRTDIVLRPCVLVTAAAVVGPDPPAGPRYLAKVRLAD